jgi:hypothetical protein
MLPSQGYGLSWQTGQRIRNLKIHEITLKENQFFAGFFSSRCLSLTLGENTYKLLAFISENLPIVVYHV